MSIFEPVSWNSDGEMRLADGINEYLYVGVTWDTYVKTLRLCRKGLRGRVYNMLRSYACNQEERAMLKEERI